MKIDLMWTLRIPTDIWPGQFGAIVSAKLLVLSLIIAFGMMLGGSQAQEPAAAEASAESRSELAEQQKILAGQFSKMEELFLRMSELESTTNPARAGLLQQAAKLSKEMATLQRMSQASDLLTQKQYTRALQEQQASRDNLAKLLELLQSENRAERVREEREKIQQLIKDIKRIERLQKSLRGRTENGADMEQAKKDQDNVEGQTEQLEAELAKELAKDSPANETNAKDQPRSKDSSEKKKDEESGEQESKPATEPKSEESKPEDSSKPSAEQSKDDGNSESKPNESSSPDSDSKPSDSKPSDSKPSDSKPSDSKPSDSKPSDSKPSDSKPSDSKPSDSKPSEQESSESSSESGDSSPQQEQQESQTPEQQARKRVEAARQRMKKAEEKLESSEREEAVQEQRNAEKELAKAVEDLEKILRQLREEEVDRSLAALEGRFRKMLELQTIVLEETKKLNALTGDARDRQVEIGASKLSLEERKILVEGQRAMLLLKEEGSSDAFPQVVEQLLLDIESVVDRLGKSDVSDLTVGTEQDIVTALEEMIEALSQAQKENEKKKQQQQQQMQQQAGQQQQEQPLVGALSELRLVKTLQVRINNRTQRLAKEIAEGDVEIGQATTAELQAQLKELAGRQDKIKQITRSILLRVQEQ